MSSPSKQHAIDALEQRLLEAARLERPDESASHRAFLALAGGALLGSATATSTAATVGAAGSAAGAHSAAAGTAGATALGGAKIVVGATTLAGVAKAVAIGAISGAVALGAAQRIQASRAPAPPTAHVERTATGPVEQARRATAAASPAEPRPSVEEIAAPSIDTPLDPPASALSRIAKDTVTKAPPRPSPALVPPTDVVEAPPNANSNAREARSLAGEVALLDQARNALVSGDPSRALLILDTYEGAQVGTTLSAEAALLRIEALVQRGDSVRAATLAQQFLRANPKSPVADRMRSIIQGAAR
jgi:hypothetical protein